MRKLQSPIGELVFIEQASMWLRCLGPDDPDVMLGGGPTGPTDAAVQLAGEVLPFLDELTAAAGKYLERFINRQVFEKEAAWHLESIVVDYLPVKATGQFGLCLTHPGDERGSWTVVFRKLLDQERAHHQRFGWPIAFHREAHH